MRYIKHKLNEEITFFKGKGLTINTYADLAAAKYIEQKHKQKPDNFYGVALRVGTGHDKGLALLMAKETLRAIKDKSDLSLHYDFDYIGSHEYKEQGRGYHTHIFFFVDGDVKLFLTDLKEVLSRKSRKFNTTLDEFSKISNPKPTDQKKIDRAKNERYYSNFKPEYFKLTNTDSYTALWLWAVYTIKSEEIANKKEQTKIGVPFACDKVTSLVYKFSLENIEYKG